MISWKGILHLKFIFDILKIRPYYVGMSFYSNLESNLDSKELRKINLFLQIILIFELSIGYQASVIKYLKKIIETLLSRY